MTVVSYNDNIIKINKGEIQIMAKKQTVEVAEEIKPEVKEKASKKAPNETAPVTKKEGVITISDLAAQFGLEGRKLRAFLRANGYSAPKLDSQGFGPKAKYEWQEGSEEHKKVVKLIKAGIEESSAE
jgi:hypothetical protein